MEKIALIGSKEFARQIREYAEETMIFKVVGYFDDYEPKGKMVDGLPILGKTNEAERLYRQGKFEKIFLAAGYKDFKFRDEIFTKLKGKIPFAKTLRWLCSCTEKACAAMIWRRFADTEA